MESSRENTHSSRQNLSLETNVLENMVCFCIEPWIEFKIYDFANEKLKFCINDSNYTKKIRREVSQGDVRHVVAVIRHILTARGVAAIHLIF